MKPWQVACIVLLIGVALLIALSTREGFGQSTSTYNGPVSNYQTGVLNTASGTNADYQKVLFNFITKLATNEQDANVKVALSAAASSIGNGQLMADNTYPITDPHILAVWNGINRTPPEYTYKMLVEAWNKSPLSANTRPDPSIVVKMTEALATENNRYTSEPATPQFTLPPDGASATPKTPSALDGGGQQYTLSCTATPVTGMIGSSGVPETPPAWDVNQPKPGWNSKYGYTTTGDNGPFASWANSLTGTNPNAGGGSGRSWGNGDSEYHTTWIHQNEGGRNAMAGPRIYGSGNSASPTAPPSTSTSTPVPPPGFTAPPPATPRPSAPPAKK
jgi:hypothetical protein